MLDQDTDKFGELYSEMSERVTLYFARRIPNYTVAEDLTSQTFLKAFENLDRYEDRGIPIKGWIFAIAHNCLIDFIRSRNVRSERQMFDYEKDSVDPAFIDNKSDPGNLVSDKVEAERAIGFLLDLPDSQSDVIELNIFNDLPLQDVAVELGISYVAARQKKFRGVRKLRKLMDQ
jgi:RNA polymerase sigma-70 factor, ECF subfamily